MVAIEYKRPHGTTANPDWMHAPDAQSLVPILTNREEEAEQFVRLAGKFRLTQGPQHGKRLEDVWLPWQRDALKASFQVREAFWLLGKGSGKSLTAAAYALAILMLNAMRGTNYRSLICIVAPNIPTAKIVFDHILEAILSDPELLSLFKSNVQERSLTHKESGIKIMVIPAAMQSAVGKRALALIVDELHIIGTQNEGLAALNQLRQGGRNFGDDFRILNISTMSTEMPAGEFKRLLDKARAVRDGRVSDEQFLPLLYQFPLKERADISPEDKSEWWRGMPSMTTRTQVGTMDIGELEAELQSAADMEDGATFELLLSQRLGIQKNLDASNAESILHAKWPDAPKCGMKLGPASTYSQVVAAIDAGGLDDPLAITVLAKRGEVFEVRTVQHLTQEGYNRQHASSQEIYDAAIDAGTLTLHDTAYEMDKDVFSMCTNLVANYGAAVGGDAMGRSGFATAFREAVQSEFTAVPQGYQLSSALNGLEGRLMDGKLEHLHCPMLDWNVQNVVFDETPQGVRKMKKRDGGASGQGRLKIDGIISVLNATYLADITEDLGNDLTHWVM